MINNIIRLLLSAVLDYYHSESNHLQNLTIHNITNNIDFVCNNIDNDDINDTDTDDDEEDDKEDDEDDLYNTEYILLIILIIQNFII